MYKVSTVEINGFWQKYRIKGAFDENVNIIIGKNGTGKTTFMNILHAVLAVDVAELFDNDFSKVVLKLVNGLKVKTIKAEKFDDADNPFPIVIYSISNRKFTVPIFANEDSRGFSYSLRRRASEEARKVKAELEELVSLASLSVYRIGSDVDPDSRERPGKRPLSPVDVRLTALMQRLTHYQLELSTEERRISSRLQRDVLVSLLYQKGAEQVKIVVA